MQTTTRIDTPILTELAQPSINLSLADLSNVDHPVNNKALSGKREGMSCMIEGFIYVASGSNPSDIWKGLVGGYVNEGTKISTATQAGVTDVASTVEFGADWLSPNGKISISANGEATVIESGYYAFKQRFRAKRAGASGYSDMFFWVEISIDGGSNWIVAGTSVDITLNNASETTVFFDIAMDFFPAGFMIRNRFTRSSTGDDSGDLIAGTPSAALLAAGVPVSPSAQITIYSVK